MRKKTIKRNTFGHSAKLARFATHADFINPKSMSRIVNASAIQISNMVENYGNNLPVTNEAKKIFFEELYGDIQTFIVEPLESGRDEQHTLEFLQDRYGISPVGANNTWKTIGVRAFLEVWDNIPNQHFSNEVLKGLNNPIMFYEEHTKNAKAPQLFMQYIGLSDGYLAKRSRRLSGVGMGPMHRKPIKGHDYPKFSDMEKLYLQIFCGHLILDRPSIWENTDDTLAELQRLMNATGKHFEKDYGDDFRKEFYQDHLHRLVERKSDNQCKIVYLRYAHIFYAIISRQESQDYIHTYPQLANVIKSYPHSGPTDPNTYRRFMIKCGLSFQSIHREEEVPFWEYIGNISIPFMLKIMENQELPLLPREYTEPFPNLIPLIHLVQEKAKGTAGT